MGWRENEQIQEDIDAMIKRQEQACIKQENVRLRKQVRRLRKLLEQVKFKYCPMFKEAQTDLWHEVNAALEKEE